METKAVITGQILFQSPDQVLMHYITLHIHQNQNKNYWLHDNRWCNINRKKAPLFADEPSDALC